MSGGRAIWREDCVEGQLQTRKWMKQTRVDKYSTEVVLQGFRRSLTMLPSKRESGFNEKDPVVDSGSGRAGS